MVAVGAVMHKICNIIFAMLRDNKPFEIITLKEHCERYAVEHPASANVAADGNLNQNKNSHNNGFVKVTLF